MAPLLDVLMTLLHWGAPGWAAALAAREELFVYARQALGAFAARHGERLLHTPGNPISLALTLDSLGRTGAPGSAGGPMGGAGGAQRGSAPGSADEPMREAGSAAREEPAKGESAVGASMTDRGRTDTGESSTSGGAGNEEEGMEPAMGGSADRGAELGGFAVGPEHASERALLGQALAGSAGAPASSRSAGAAEPLGPGRRPPPGAAEAHSRPGPQPASEHAAQECAAERGAPAEPLRMGAAGSSPAAQPPPEPHSRPGPQPASEVAAQESAAERGAPAESLPVGAAGSGPAAAQPPPVAYLGSMLFKRCVSGTRVVARGKRAEVAGHAFTGYGAHCDAYPHDYLTFAAALGTSRADVDAFVRRLEQCFAEFRARRGSAGSAST